MSSSAAKKDDQVTGMDTHLVNGSPIPLPFAGGLDGNLSANVIIEHEPAAMLDSAATNVPPHVAPPGKSFDKPPRNKAVIVTGSGTVLINGRPAARDGDVAKTCCDPEDQPVGTVVASSTVLVGK